MTQETEHAALLNAIMETAVDAIIVIDCHGIIQQANPATERLFGYPPQDVVGKNVSMLMPAPERESHDRYLTNYLTSGQPQIIGIGREVVGRRKDGTTFPVHLAVSEAHVGNRRLFTGVVRDISDLKEAEHNLNRMNEQLEGRVRERTAELRQAQNELVRQEKMVLLGKVSGGIAHEIRNPLNVIRTSAYFLRHAKQPSITKTGEHLERIDRQVTLIDHVVTALADVACLPEPKHDACNISIVLADAVQNTSLPSSVQIDDQVPQDVPMVLIDANQISIVFRNLLQNASDAMTGGGTITISSHVSDTTVTIHVADTGSGIKPEDIDRVMEPFFSTKARGMGLGLAISHTIVQKNLGVIAVSSQPNQGTTFSISLPIA